MAETILHHLAAILILGIGAQWIAWRIRLPSILLLLLCGFVAGPVLHWLNPDELFGNLLMPLVSVSVGLILFEGGLTLKFSELKAVGTVVRNLITVGALITWALATVAARYIFQWDWPLSLLFGSILIVTGPTVIMPLLRHVKPARQIASALKWEGILIDPIGALVALLVFEGITAHGDQSVPTLTLMSIGKTILFGGLSGVLAALILTQFFKRYWIPDYLQNPVALMAVVAVFTLSNSIQHESGLLAVTVMGIALANQKSVHIRHIVEFKENLRVLLIAGLFVLLSARIRIEDIQTFGFAAALAFLGALMLVVRPVSVFASTLGSKLTFKDKCFLSWMAPRGIVAAAVASIFALRLAESGHDRAQELVSATFIVIVGTVAIYGLTASPLAKALGLSTPNPQGLLILGAHRLARVLAKGLKDAGFAVLLADTNRDNTAAARMEGLPVYTGNALSEHALDELELTGLGRLMALTPNHEVNAMAAMHFREQFGRAEVYQIQVHPETAKETKSDPHGRLLFGPDILLGKLTEKLAQGAVLRRTSLTENFNFEHWKATHGQHSVPLFLVTAEKKLRLITRDNPPKPEPGQTILALGQPSEKKSADPDPAPDTAPKLP